jgi:hypothetical protein
MPETTDTSTVVPFPLPRDPDNADEMDAMGLLAQCEVLTASSEVVGYRTKLTLKHRDGGAAINVTTYTDEDYRWALVERGGESEEIEDSEHVYALEEAALNAEQAAADDPALVKAARRVLAAAAKNIFVDARVCRGCERDVVEMHEALVELERTLEATAPTP